MTIIAIAIVGRKITLEREPSKKKQRTDSKKMQRGLRVKTLQGAMEKSVYGVFIFMHNRSSDIEGGGKAKLPFCTYERSANWINYFKFLHSDWLKKNRVKPIEMHHQ